MSGPGDIVDDREVERLSLDIRASDFEFLTQFAAYRNALAAALGKRIRKKWSRKSLGESFIAMQVDAAKAQLAEMFKACGPMPDADDTQAMAEYVARVLEWDARRNSEPASESSDE